MQDRVGRWWRREPALGWRCRRVRWRGGVVCGGGSFGYGEVVDVAKGPAGFPYGRGSAAVGRDAVVLGDEPAAGVVEADGDGAVAARLGEGLPVEGDADRLLGGGRGPGLRPFGGDRCHLAHW